MSNISERWFHDSLWPQSGYTCGWYLSHPGGVDSFCPMTKDKSNLTLFVSEYEWLSTTLTAAARIKNGTC